MLTKQCQLNERLYLNTNKRAYLNTENVTFAFHIKQITWLIVAQSIRYLAIHHHMIIKNLNIGESQFCAFIFTFLKKNCLLIKWAAFKRKFCFVDIDSFLFEHPDSHYNREKSTWTATCFQPISWWVLGKLKIYSIST